MCDELHAIDRGVEVNVKIQEHHGTPSEVDLASLAAMIISGLFCLFFFPLEMLPRLLKQRNVTSSGEKKEDEVTQEQTKINRDE